MLNYFDSHCHPQLSVFDRDRAEVLARMKEQRVGGLVVGTDLKESRAAVLLAGQHDFLWAAVGLHPNDNPEETFDEQAFRELARDPKVVALGECGLDYYRNEPTENERARQAVRFQKHIALAVETKKPLMIHCRPTRNSMNAHRDMSDMLKRHPEAKAVMHFFTGNIDIAKQYLELGCYLSFPGVVTFTDEYDEVVRVAPLDRILSETDSPFASPVPYRGERNEPVHVIEVVKKIAELKNSSLEEAGVRILQNAKEAFGFD